MTDISKLKKVCEGVYEKNKSTYYILCSISKVPCYCSGDRLKKLIEKHGSCEKAAASYVSRDAKRLIKSKVPAKSVMKMEKSTLREEATEVQKERTRRREERRRRRETREAIRNNDKPLTYNPAPPQHIDLISPESIAANTVNGCLYPNRFLDNERTCNKCNLHEHCSASMKVVLVEGKTKRKKVVAAA
jgi:hypothetical protein